MRLAFRIAWRFLVSSKAQTVLIAVGIAVGIAVQVFIGSLITGLQDSLVQKTIGRSPHITITASERGERIANYADVEQALRATDGVSAVLATADGSGFLVHGNDTAPILLRGMNPADADSIYRLNDALTEGTLPADEQVLLGQDLADELGLTAGDTLSLLTPTGATAEATVSGLFDLQVKSLNESWAFAPMAFSQQLFGYGEEATGLELQVQDVFAADELAASLQPTLPEGLTADNWKAQNASLLSGLNGQSVSSIMIQVFVLVSVVLGIASVLAISVLQKSRQLGILKAMGIRNGTASLIFLFQGLLLGLIGAALGVGLGLGLSVLFTRFAVNPDGTPVVPLSLDPAFLSFSALVGILSATVAALIPARRSARLDPMEVIKNG